MRRVDAEGDSRGSRDHEKRAEAGSRSKLRKAAIEWLERRELLSTSTSTLPAPVVLSAPNVTPNMQVQDASLATAAQALTTAPYASSPSVSVDPINPQKIVATWVDHDAVGFTDFGRFTAPVTDYIEGAFSANGGASWSPLPGFGVGSVNTQFDDSVTQPTNGQVTVLTQTTDATIGFDRNENFYILSSTHDAPGAATITGILDLQRYSWVGNNAPSFKGTTPIYSWDSTDGGGGDAAVTPTLAIDTNVPSFTDPSTAKVQTDAFSGNLYAVWAEQDINSSPGAIPNFNPDTIRMAASSDQGLQFTHAAYVDDSSNANGHNVGVVTNPPNPQSPLHDAAARYSEPQVTISQGNGTTVTGGQVTIVYDDYATVAPLDQILAQTELVGGTSEQFTYSNANQIPNINQEIPIGVNITDPKFTTLQALDITNTVAWPNISEIAGILIPPAPIVTYLQKALNDPFFEEIVLFDGDIGVEASGTPSSAKNLGGTTGSGFGDGSGLVFDPEAIRSIEDGTLSGKSAVGHFQADDEEAIVALQGLTANPNGTKPGLNGIWNYEVVQIASDTTTNPKFVNGVTLNFSSGNNPGAAAGTAGAESLIVGKNSLFISPLQTINPTNPAAANGDVINTDNTGSPLYNATGGTNVTANPNAPILSTVEGAIPLLPAPVIASDNTLGSFSSHPGRIYVSFTGMFTGAAAGNTDIFMSFSDDGGKTWSNPTQVNDDNAQTDGASGSTPGGALGRTQFEPQIAVDQSTGNLVLSFLDARTDPSNARVATYIAVSNDGGATFAPQVYANRSSFALDAVTGKAVNLGPVPDNESTTGGQQALDAAGNGYGTHQALIVTNGAILPFWTSNQNMSVPSAIVDSIMLLAAGPRVISSTQGPVGGSTDTTNTSKAADGTTLANTITVTFDQEVDPTTFQNTNVLVFYKAPTGGASISLPIVSVLPVAGSNDSEFAITFNPASLAASSFVGTYSYQIIPTGIRSRSRTVNAPVVTAGVFGFAAPVGAAVTDNNMDGYASSSVTVAGLPVNEFLVGDPTGANLVNAAFPNGNTAGTLTATISAGNAGDAEDDFTVNLVTPDGQRIPLTGTFNMTGTTITFNATKFSVPWVNTVPIDGKYTLEVIDNPNQDPISISAWHLTLNGQIATQSSKLGNVMDQNADGTSGQLTNDKNTAATPFQIEAGDNYVVGQPTGFTNYATATLPLIVSGPHLTSTAAINTAGTVISTGTNNLVLNNTVAGIQVIWDRNILVSTFNTHANSIISIMGPEGAISLTGITITPVSVFTAGGQVAYSNGATADVFNITFPAGQPQQISGTYTVTFGTGVVASDGSGVDTNENAGLDALRGTATNGVTVPVTYSAASPAVPGTIAAATVNASGVTVPSMLFTPINVPIDFPVQPDNLAAALSGITLTFNINYPNDPDLTAFLVSPSNTMVELFSNVGSGTKTANFTNTIISDTATTLLANAGAPFFGTFLPKLPLANFVGQATLGNWQLLIENAGNSVGTLNSWSITFQKPVSSTGLAEFPDDQSHSSFQIFNLAASNALANSTWTAVGPAGITPGAATVPVTFVPSATAALSTTIPGGSVATPGVFSSLISIPANLGFALQADTATAAGLTLSLDITDADDASLTAFLMAPNGTQIRLFTNVGGIGANFTGTTFSDLSGSSIDTAGAPFVGTFAPEGSFNLLATQGASATGNWTLVIQNNSAATGTLNDWSLTFQKPSATFSGAVSSVAVDPSDKTGNTVYLGTASGGVWKTTDFLTTNPAGPTYIPLTQFGPNFSLNIGSIATFGVNDDPAQTVIFAGTGFAQEATTANTGAANVDLNSGRGVGILRSADGGVTWTVLDSSANYDANGIELPEAARDHLFVGDTTYKIVVDPTPELDGEIIVYAALGGPTGGLYQSLDSGNTWALLQGGTCTDILLDPNSKSITTGNLDTLYASFTGGPQANGIYISTNEGQTLHIFGNNGNQAGQSLGYNPLIVTPGFPAAPIKVNSVGVTPNFVLGEYVVLAKPALTGNTAQDLGYQGWLYAAVENVDGTFHGLYVTKDNGENWTLVQIPNIPGTGSVKSAIPTDDTSGVNSYDPTSSKFNQQGKYNLTLTVDPTNPNIVYVGGSQDFQGSGMIRVNLTQLYDAHNFTSFSNKQTDGGALFVNAQGGITTSTANPAAYQPIAANPIPQILNLRYAPDNPFNINATLVVSGVNNAVGFVNSGTGVTWSPFDEPLQANAGDGSGSTNIHDVIDYVDPITGNVRLLIADDEGIFTALANPDGTLDNGTGTDLAANYSRNGNLQDEQILTSAAQPSFVATQAAGALFFASGQSNLAAESAADILTAGDLTWNNQQVLEPTPTSPRNTSANNSIISSDRSGVGIATDQTGSTAVYEFDVPILGGNLTDFFRVNQFGSTTGLASNVGAEFPQQGYRGDAQVSGYTLLNGAIASNGQLPLGNFEVNPLNGSQILIGSATGNLYETTDQGSLFSAIGDAADFQVNTTGNQTPIQFSAISFGAPDPNVKGGVGNLNNFIYVGTTGSPLQPGAAPVVQSDGLIQNDGRIFFTQAGGQGWTNASKGLDGSSVVGIYPDPDRGSHAAYAVTLTGVYYSPDTVALAKAGQTVWTNITSNLTSIQRNPFGDATFQQSVLAGFVGVTGNGADSDVFTAQYGGFTSIVADYRYEIPAATNATQGTNIFYPVLYVSGYGGVFRSIDNGATWTVFPNTAFDAAPVDGGYLPSVDVSNLQLVLGDINPATGHPTQASNSAITGATPDPEVLLASTFGAGDYAIRLAPDVIPDSVVLDPTQPPPDGSDSSQGSDITNVPDPFMDGVSEVSNFGNVVTINLIDESPNSPFKGTVLGTGRTNALGQFVHLDPANNLFDLPGIQISLTSDPWFNTISSTAINDKVVGIRATDSSGASGNLTLFSYTLDLITPVTPNAPVLEPAFDTGRSQTDGLTNLSVPPQAGPGAPLTVVTPTFDVITSLPQANPLTPNPIALTIELLRASSANGPFFVINQSQTGVINNNGSGMPVSETYMLTDPTIAALALPGINQTFFYEALQIDEAGNVSQPASNIEPVTVNTIAPPAPTGFSLVTQSSTSPPHPVFSVAGVLPNDQVLLYRSINGGAPILVNGGQTVINATNAVGTFQVTDTMGASPDGVYTYFSAQLDVFGNFSPLFPTNGLIVTINTQTPPAPPILEAAYDTGRFNNDDKTDIAVPAPTPGSTPTFVAPVFDINTTAPPVGQPAIATVELYRATSAGGPYTLVGTSAFNGNPAMVVDTTLQATVLADFSNGMPLNQTFFYEADQINAAGITSAKSGPLSVVVDTVTPKTLAAPTLDPFSNTGLITSQLITNQTNPTFDVTTLLANDQLFLYRASGGKAQILVGTGPINPNPIGGASIAAKVTDTTGATPDGVYQYFVVQRDVFGNVSSFSPSIAVTVNTTHPSPPTIALLSSDDTGLPSHPNVTSVNTPHFVGTAQYNASTNFPVAIVNAATGAVLTTLPFYPAANGFYEAQITTPLPDGTYTLEARSENQAGNFSFSAPLVITILHNGPQITPTLTLAPVSDTGVKGDGITSNHAPKFIGTTDKGDTVNLYVLINGVLQGPEATTTSSTINGSFTFQLPFNLTDGTTQLIAQTSDVAGNKGLPSLPYTVQIVSTQGDYTGTGKAQLTVFDPYNETYYVRGVGALQVDVTPGRDVPVQYDYNGDAFTDLVAYRYDTATYFGYQSNNSVLNYAYGPGGSSLPVSGYYGNSGTFIYGSYQAASGTWFIALPVAGGLVVQFGLPKIDIPAPAAYNGFNSTELTVFRNTPIFGGDADSFSVIGPQGFYMVSFTSPRAQQLGFVYKPGDIAAPADYDGLGRDEFAVYRPSTGQFFILNTPVDSNPATWTLRTVTLNLPGGPNVNDEPVSQDYDGDGKADPTVYRPSNSTFYMVQSSTNTQINIPFGPAGQSIAAAGPILYRLNALFGIYASGGGYYSVITTAGGGGGGGLSILSVGGGGGTVRAESISQPTTSKAATAPQSGSPTASMIALAAPLPVNTSPVPSAPVVSLAVPTAMTPVTVGASTPKVLGPVAAATPLLAGPRVTTRTSSQPKVVESKVHESKAPAHQAKAQPKAPAKLHLTTPAKVTSTAEAKSSHIKAAAMAATSLQHLVMAKKGGKKKG